MLTGGTRASIPVHWRQLKRIYRVGNQIICVHIPCISWDGRNVGSRAHQSDPNMAQFLGMIINYIFQLINLRTQFIDFFMDLLQMFHSHYRYILLDLFLEVVKEILQD
ncbi:hypothetical protein NDU88_001233 [Pleurodeles waltl]|uniref:Uncharacterized protein n=1 Tax=Pleurodeles waltl TaxID=8319 RepID=A0AAV7P7B7_PLEWA|nr:hypothetical protein NDU88_001233 [Pleurodeles waltl]